MENHRPGQRRRQDDRGGAAASGRDLEPRRRPLGALEARLFRLLPPHPDTADLQGLTQYIHPVMSRPVRSSG